jgi:A/G-specific adenine glycosylase
MTKMSLSGSAELAVESFSETVYAFYCTNRRDLPWRHTTDPYLILVSEIMLQQTQVGRVIEKYEQFAGKFPDLRSLAKASLTEVLVVWQGLGYNRRALMLKKLAEEVVARFDGRLPSDERLLMSLPGVGAYTAAAVQAFAFDLPVVLIETNVRSVFIHHFFHDREGVPDHDILPLVEAALDRNHPREWYSALMDYGSYLKTLVANPGRKSAHYTRQTQFEGSDRQLRGKILRFLVDGGKRSGVAIVASTGAGRDRVSAIIDRLVLEGLLVREKRSYRVP